MYVPCSLKNSNKEKIKEIIMGINVDEITFYVVLLGFLFMLFALIRELFFEKDKETRKQIVPRLLIEAVFFLFLLLGVGYSLHITTDVFLNFLVEIGIFSFMVFVFNLSFK
jgi:hypothetical protein